MIYIELKEVIAMKKDNTKLKNDAVKRQNAAVIPFRKKKKGGMLGRIVRRFLLVLIAVIVLLLGDLLLVLNLVFNGPSPTARNQLTMALIEASATKWGTGAIHWRRYRCGDSGRC